MARPFEQILTEMRNGAVAEQLTDAFDELLQAVHKTGKGGTLTLTIGIKPNGENALAMSAKVATKEPKPDVGESFFFVDDSGNLCRNDPRQMNMFDNGPKMVHSSTMVAHGD